MVRHIILCKRQIIKISLKTCLNYLLLASQKVVINIYIIASNPKEESQEIIMLILVSRINKAKINNKVDC